MKNANLASRVFKIPFSFLKMNLFESRLLNFMDIRFHGLQLQDASDLMISLRAS